MAHWALKYLGERWTEEYNCFHFFAKIQKEIFGIEGLLEDPTTPDYSHVGFVLENLDSLSIAKNWVEVDIPKEGDAVIFGVLGVSFHIGVYVVIDGAGGVLHSNKKGAVITTRRAIIDGRCCVKKFLRYSNDKV